MTGSGGAPNSGQPNVALVAASILAQVGCFTLFVVALAIGGGLWLDTQLDTKPLFTVIFVLASVPVTFYFLIRFVLRGTSRLQVNSNLKSELENIEEEHSGRNA
jgi:hypothetical protein